MDLLIRLNRLKKDGRFFTTILKKRPIQALVQVTNRCNMTCGFCDFWPHGDKPNELSVDDYRKVSDDLARLGSMLISIEGGEPFVRGDILKIIETFAEHHQVLVYTNGWFIDDALAKAVFAAGAAQVGVSIDYPDERHDDVRGQAGAFERAKNALASLKMHDPKGGRQVHVMSVLMRDNQFDWPALFSLSAEHGVRHAVTLLSAKGFRRDGSAHQLPEAGAMDALDELYARFGHVQVFKSYIAGMQAFTSGGTLAPCRAGAQSFNIDHVGNVAPCIEKIDAPVGNVKNSAITALLPALGAHPDVPGCNDCFTLCRGTAQALGGGSSIGDLYGLATRLRA